MPERFDVIVVGGGTAGCVLAARLSEEPERKVCLVEAGPDYGRHAEGRWPADMLDARSLPMSHLWETEPDDRSASRARILGGCSAHNACLVVWGSRDDYDEWGDGWTFAELEPYLRRAEASIRTRTDRTDDLSPFHRALLEAGPRIGLPRLADLNDLDAVVGIAPAPVNALGAVRWNTAFAYLDDARSRPNLTIVPETLVDQVEISAGRAHGVVWDSGRLAADTVIVAAGAYGSPALLLRSGIGPHAQLGRLGIGVIEDLPVGVGLVDHPGVGIEWAPAAAHVPETWPRVRDLAPGSRPERLVPERHVGPPLSPLARGSGRGLADERGRVPPQAGFPRQRHAALTRPAGSPRHRPRLPLRTARPRPPLERHRARPRARPGGGIRTRAPPRRSRRRSTPISDARSGESSTPPAPARSGRSSTHAALCWASTGFSSRTPRSCRRSPARTRT